MHAKKNQIYLENCGTSLILKLVGGRPFLGFLTFFRTFLVPIGSDGLDLSRYDRKTYIKGI